MTLDQSTYLTQKIGGKKRKAIWRSLLTPGNRNTLKNFVDDAWRMCALLRSPRSRSDFDNSLLTLLACRDECPCSDDIVKCEQIADDSSMPPRPYFKLASILANDAWLLEERMAATDSINDIWTMNPLAVVLFAANTLADLPGRICWEIIGSSEPTQSPVQGAFVPFQRVNIYRGFHETSFEFDIESNICERIIENSEDLPKPFDDILHQRLEAALKLIGWMHENASLKVKWSSFSETTRDTSNREVTPSLQSMPKEDSNGSRLIQIIVKVINEEGSMPKFNFTAESGGKINIDRSIIGDVKNAYIGGKEQAQNANNLFSELFSLIETEFRGEEQIILRDKTTILTVEVAKDAPDQSKVQQIWEEIKQGLITSAAATTIITAISKLLGLM